MTPCIKLDQPTQLNNYSNTMTMAIATPTAPLTAQQVYQAHYDRAWSDPKLKKQNDERKLSNQAKRIVIQTVIAPFIDHNTWINDLANGKCNDFQKYVDVLTPVWHPQDNRIRYIGSDISFEGVKEGQRRIAQQRLGHWFKSFQCDLMGQVIPSDGHLRQTLQLNKSRNNVVSVQNAIQYSFQSEETFQNMITNMLISEPNVIFLTYPDPEKIRSGQQFKTARISDVQIVDRFFGSQYNYCQSGTCVETPFQEYLVDETILESVLSEQGYDLIFDRSHMDIVGTPADSAVSLYKSTVFKKRAQ